MIKVEIEQNDTEMAIRRQKHGITTWLDVSRPSDEVFATLEQEYHLHPVHLQESIQPVQHSQVEQTANYLFFALHIPIYDPVADKIVAQQVGVFLGKDYLITISKGAAAVVTEMFDKCAKQPVVAQDYFERGAAYVLYQLVNNVLQAIFTMTDSVGTELDTIEDMVFDNNHSDAQRIGKVRQHIVKLERIIGTKRIVLSDLAQRVKDFSGQGNTEYYLNNSKTANKLWEVIEEAKETVEIYKDADFTTSTEQTNQILAVLTLVFTLSIPVTVLGAVYGMNVQLPGGLAAGEWTFWGRYTTLGLLLAVSIGCATAMYLYCKRKGWF